VKRRLEQLWAEREGRLSHTNAQLRLFVRDRLLIEAQDERNPPSVRVRAVELIGKIGGVAIFESDTGKPVDNQGANALLQRIESIMEHGRKLAATQDNQR
jgi:hypothetical protein